MEAKDQQINLLDSKAQVLPKTQSLDFLKAEKAEPFVKMEPVYFTKIEPVGKTEPLDFPKIEPVDKREPLDFSKVEPIGKTEPLDFPTTKTVKLFGQPLFGSKFINEEGKDLLLKLNRIRDFISLLLSYPMRTGHDSKLKVWTRQVSNGDLLEADLWLLQRQNPLRCLEGLIPMEMIMDIEAGASCIFADKNVIPEAILNLAADLSVHQLLQTLLSGDDHVHNIHHVMLSTRNGAEKRAVVKKIEAAWKHNDNILRLNDTFSGVLLIDASIYQSQSEFNVRRQIAQQLQLPMIAGDEVEHSDEWLITRIEKEMSRKKYLVLLVDWDIEEPLDPRKVGFPEEEIAGVVVLITSRYPNQANDELIMSMDLNIRTEDHVLSWEVFCRNVGNELVRSSNVIKRIAVRIVEECGGHLLAAVLVAKSLKNVEDVRQWERALDMLRYPDPLYDISGFHGVSRVMVRAFLNFIWNHINQTQKHCLTCCLFIPDMKVGKLYYELTDAWVSDLLVDAGEADHNLRVLVERSVLLQFEGILCKHIRIPEDTYAILQSLNTLNPLLIKEVGLGLTEPPNKELWHCAVNIELANNKLSELPLSPNSLELKVLLLQGNTDLTKIPPLFFIKMPLLCILDLSYTSVRELPNSLFELEQLRELYLKGCECFMKLTPEIGKLKKLEKLDLDETYIIHLPEEIQELTNLEKLILCFYEYRGKKSKKYTYSTIIPPGVISRLKGLQYLSINVNPDDERWHENVQVILPEVLELVCLRTLNLYIPQMELLKLIPAHIFELNFRFVVGRHIQRIISGTPPTDEAKFKQSGCSCKFVKGMDVPSEIKTLVKHSKALFLDRHMTMKSLSEFEMMNLEQIRVCILAECKEMQAIIDERHSYSNEDILPHLLYLSASYMKNLRNIWKGPIPSSCSFGVLKSLALQHCPKLTTVFTLDFLGNLSLLKELIVKDCPKVNTLVSDGSSKLKAEIFLPKLRKVLLLHLPELTNISNGLLIGPNLEYIGICNCRKLQNLSKMELSSQKLRVIKGETKWWDELKWSELEWERACQPPKFNHIFSSIIGEADLMTQFRAYGDEDIDKCPVFEGEPSLPVGDAMPLSKSPSLRDMCSRNQKKNASRSRSRSPSCEKERTKKGAWTKEEDECLINYINRYGCWNWSYIPKAAGLRRSGKSCRLRWMNYLRPNVKRGNFRDEEEQLIIELQSLLGNKWSLIASRLPGRTGNEIRNYWNTHIKRKLYSRGIDPQTHRPLNAATATPTAAAPPWNPTAATSPSIPTPATPPSTPTAAASPSNPIAAASPSIAMPTWEMICDLENIIGNSF